ncbi:MAG: hypothetical protein ACLFN5_03380 [bacterium]
MIVHIQIPDFIAIVQARSQGLAGEAVIVSDNSQILSVNQESRQLGLRPGCFLENQVISADVHNLDFDLKPLNKAQAEFKNKVQKLSPLVEILNLGEVFIEVEDLQPVKKWFDKQENNCFPITAAAAPTGWLARIVSNRGSTDFVVIDSDYREKLEEVKIAETWGLGSDFQSKMRRLEIETLAELARLSEMERRKHLGVKSRIVHKIFNRRDPRALSVFSRPRSLSREISLADEEKVNKDMIIKKIDPVLKLFQQRLRDSVSCTHRLRLVLDFQAGGRLLRSHVFPQPADDVRLFKLGLRKMLRDVVFSTAPKSVAVEADVIVADLQNYHLKAQEAATDFEIIENSD